MPKKLTEALEVKKGKRWQIPASSRLAEDMEILAKTLDVSVSRLGQRFIEEAMLNKKRLGSWLLRRVTGPGTERKQMGWRQTAEESNARLQITIWEATANELESAANRLNHTPVRFAALVLDFALDDIGPGMKLLNSWPLSKLYDILPLTAPADPEKSADEIELMY